MTPGTTARRRGPALRQQQLPAVRTGNIRPDARRHVPGTSRRHHPIAPTASSSVRAKHIVALDNRTPPLTTRQRNRLGVTLMRGAGRIRDVVIVGSGPAGYTAAIYAARSGLDTLVVEGHLPGGALMAAGLMDNTPAFVGPCADPASPARCGHKHIVSVPSSTPVTSTGWICKVRSSRSPSTTTCVTLLR